MRPATRRAAAESDSKCGSMSHCPLCASKRAVRRTDARCPCACESSTTGLLSNNASVADGADHLRNAVACGGAVFKNHPHPSNVPARNWGDAPLLRVFCDAHQHEVIAAGREVVEIREFLPLRIRSFCPDV